MTRTKLQERLRSLREQLRNVAMEIADVVKNLDELRPCGCPLRGPHSPSCNTREINPAHPWNGTNLTCCGSTNRYRHSVRCEFNNRDGRLPANATSTWRCTDCPWETVTPDKPNVCGDCGSPLLVQKFV